MKGYGPDGSPPPACVAPFAVVSTTAGFRAAYDPNGNMVLRVECRGEPSCSPITYTQGWDVENRLSVVTNTVTGEVTRFTYDGDGKRVLREDGSGVTVYLGAVEVHVTGTERVTKTYYFAGSQRIAMSVSGSGGGELTYLHGDHLGSASLATDATAQPFHLVRDATPPEAWVEALLRSDDVHIPVTWGADDGQSSVGKA